MWIFTRDGFFSVTQNTRTDDNTLMVRARVETDLEKFLQRIKLDTEIIETPKSDYRYRVIVPRGLWVKYLTEMVGDLDYTNVKDTLAPMKTEAQRHSAMMGCWTAMARLQPGGAYAESRIDNPHYSTNRRLPLEDGWWRDPSRWDDDDDDDLVEDDDGNLWDPDDLFCDLCQGSHFPDEACEMIGR